jgi:outer membrane protein OmpA-like peptidoglycan-associated protein
MLPSLTHRRCALGALSLLLASCAGTGPPLPQRPGVYTAPVPGSAPPAPLPGAQPPAGAPAAPAPPALTPLLAEQRFFESWFGSTPVVIAAQAPTTLQLDVPLNFSFDSGKAEVKPALNKVLDRVAESLRRQAGARIVVVAPPDVRGAATTSPAKACRRRASHWPMRRQPAARRCSCA